MTKKTKFKICDWSLLFLSIVILASGLQLEINPAGKLVWVWLHIAIGSAFSIGIIWHIILHKQGMKSSVQKPQKQKHKPRHPVMGIFFILTLLSGIIATCHWIGTYFHSTIGGIHGKIGFIFIILVGIHMWKNRRFYHR